MNYSTNYSMREPVPGEKVKVADINYNTEIIDGVMLDNRQISIDMYDDTSTYNTDDLAGHENASGRIAVYRCLADNTTGVWDSTKWVQTNLADEITYIRGNAGASDLSDLNDVDLTNPTDGQALLYDDTTDKWHNSDLPDADVTKEASGNPIEITDAAAAPLVKCVTQITGYQEGTGTPSPDNVRPIVAYTEGEIEVRGKNLAPSSPISRGQYVDGAFQNNNNRICSDYINLLPNVIYTASIDRSNTENLAFINYAYFDKNKTYLGDRATNGEAVFSGDKVHTFSVSNAQAAYIRLIIRAYSSPDLNISDKTLDNAQLMFEKGTTHTTYEPYTSTTHTTTYPSAIYRGSEDVVNGEVTSEWPCIDLGDLTWVKNDSELSYTYFYADVSDKALNYNQICSNYNAVEKHRGQLENGEIGIYNASNKADRICIRDDAKRSLTDVQFKAAMVGVSYAYELATPTTSSVTPTNLPVKSLSGYNHIESSTGEMEVEYFPAKEQPLIDLIPEASNMHEYSTAEHAVGTWIDGETIYEQTYNYTGTGAANPFTTTIDMTGKHIVEVIPHYARYTYNSGQGYGECIGSEMLYSNSNVLNIRYVDSVPYTLTVSSTMGSTESYDIAFTLRYTKTSSNNRSLAKSAPQEETKEEVKEEPEEPVEEVKEEETKEEGEVNER